ncbi:MAG: glycosyltransferase, partial [Hymenobacteraceae bacterium]|nr:glycosyltransferase [Hymenobacteraceae bacterium]
LHAFAKVRERFPDLKYHLVGVDMEENGPAHQYARQHHLDTGVVFLGPQPFEEVVRQLAGAKVLLHPSMEESFGMAVLEAMVSGTAVVGGHRSGFIPHLLNYGKAGTLCNIYSPDEMASAVTKLLKDQAFRETTVRDAKRYVQANFSEEVIVNKHLAYYSEILGRKLVPEKEKAAYAVPAADSRLSA